MTHDEKVTALKGIAVASAELVYHYKLIGRSINKDEDTLAKWRNADPDFADQLEQGRDRFLKKHMKAAKPEFLLERMEPLFRQKTETDITSKGEAISPIAPETIAKFNEFLKEQTKQD